MSRTQIEALIKSTVGEKIGEVRFSQTSDQEPEIETLGYKKFDDSTKPVTPKTIFGLGSLSKLFTVATFIKLWDIELSRTKESGAELQWFKSGVDTPLAHFLPHLKERFPDCTYFENIEQSSAYRENNVTLRDLLNHTHGLGSVDSKSLKAFANVDARGRALEFSEMVNCTALRPGETYGTYKYGTLGYDLGGMIAQIIAQDLGLASTFDQAAQNLVINKHQLNSTYPTAALADLEQNPEADLASGYVIYDQKLGNSSHPKQLDSNIKSGSGSRAAAGFKSNVADLNKFAKLFFSAEMFENSEVKTEMLDYQNKGVVRYGQSSRYHLGTFTNLTDANIRGHSGSDSNFITDLRYNTQTGDTVVWLSVTQNLTRHFVNAVFANLHSDKAGYEIFQNFSERLDDFSRRNPCHAERGHVEWQEAVFAIAEEALRENPQGQALAGEYFRLYDTISREYPARDLALAVEEERLDQLVVEMTEKNLPRTAAKLRETEKLQESSKAAFLK